MYSYLHYLGPKPSAHRHTKGEVGAVGIDIREKKTGGFFREILKEEKVGCWRTESGSSFQVRGPETEKARGPKVLSFVRGVWRMR